MSTPNELWSTVIRCWNVEPTSQRIIDDIMGFEDVIDKVIAAQGCVVTDLRLRHGRRYEPAHPSPKNKANNLEASSTDSYSYSGE